MVEQKLYKTKLCILYQKGRCLRQSCSFAHGNVELRGFVGSYNDRRDNRDSDLRDKLDRRHSPSRRDSRGRDVRDRHTFRGYSPSRSLERTGKHKKRNRFDGQSDYSESPRISNGIEDKEGKTTSPNNKTILRAQLKNLLSEIDVLDRHKSQLEDYLQQTVQEKDSLSSRNLELEAQLYKANEECKRITSKIKKFVKAHNRHSRIQDELKRSQARLEKLGGQLGSDALLGDNEEDSNVNIVSDVEITGIQASAAHNELQNDSTPSKKRPPISFEGEERSAETIRLGKRSRWNIQAAEGNNDKEVEAVNNGNNDFSSLPSETTRKRGKTSSTLSMDKLKGSESKIIVRSTSIAAQAVDEDVEIEDGKIDVTETASMGIEKGSGYTNSGFPLLLPPPPPLPRNYLKKFKGDDENVDIDGLEEDIVEVDII